MLYKPTFKRYFISFYAVSCFKSLLSALQNVCLRTTICDRHPNGIRSGGGRNLIGRRTESDQAADGIRSGGERNPIGRRTESDRAANGIRSGGGRKR